MIDPITAVQATFALPDAKMVAALHETPTSATFTGMLMQGVENASAKISEANRLVAAYVVDDTVPVHQVTFALEEARQSLEMMIQVRNKMVEAYQSLMSMQV